MAKKTIKNWNSGITGKIKAFRNEYDGKVRFTSSLGKKDEKTGEFEKLFFDVKFAKSAAEEIKTLPKRFSSVDVDIDEAFLTFDSWVSKVDGYHQRLTLVILDCEVMEYEK